MLIPIGKEKERKVGKSDSILTWYFFNVLLLTFNTEQFNFITNNRLLQVKIQRNWRKAPLNLFTKNKAEQLEAKELQNAQDYPPIELYN